MKRLVLTAIFITILTTSAQAGEMYINGSSRYGCADKEYYSKTTEMVAQNDLEAFKKTLGAGLATGLCTMFRPNEPIFVVDTGFLMSKVRRRGDTAEYWLETQAISNN